MKSYIWHVFIFPVLMFVMVFTVGGCQHLPGGSSIGIQFQLGGNPPTAKEAKVARANDKVLINGQPVDRSKYPSVVRLFIGSASCTANVVGKRRILTAAHCGETGDVATFQTVSGKKYSAKLVQAPGYPGKDLDLNVGVTTVDIDVPPMKVFIEPDVQKREKKGMDVTMIGYGCIKPGGSGGNDGILRMGKSKVAAGQGYDLVLKNPDGAALCYGDSGGPLFAESAGGGLIQIAVNSKGNIEDTSYCTRTTLDEAAAFLQSVGGICGASEDCGSGSQPPPPLPPPGSKYSVSDDGKGHVEVFIK